jgi:hypothetical protein
VTNPTTGGNSANPQNPTSAPSVDIPSSNNNQRVSGVLSQSDLAGENAPNPGGHQDTYSGVLGQSGLAS